MFLNRNNLDDSDFNKRIKNEDNSYEKRQFNIPRLPLIIVGGIILLIIVILLVAKLLNKNNIVIGEEKLYYINLLGEASITVYEGDIYVEPGYTASDDKGNDLTSKVVTSDNINNEEIGNYKVTYTLGNVTKERTVKVIEKPIGATTIHLYGDVNVFLYVGEKYEEKRCEVIDTVDSDSLNDKVIINSNVNTDREGIYKVIYSVTNSSGVTTSKERTVIVIDPSLSLIPNKTEPTNGNVTINIYAKDELFSYVILPNNNKETKTVSTYEVSSNGTYKFVMYNTKGESKEKKIEITNIDREVPSGSCSGYYGSGISQINVNAKDNVGISKYMIDGTSYTTNSIKLNKEVSSVNVTIYDKAGNTKEISCKLEDKRPPSSKPSSSKPSSSKPAPASKPSYTLESLMYKDLCEEVYEITAEDLNRLFEYWAEIKHNPDSPLLGTGDAWIKACEATGLDPTTLIGISGAETGRGSIEGMGYMKMKNFFGMDYIDPTGDGTQNEVYWGPTDLFHGDVYKAVLQSAKRIKNFYYTKYGGVNMVRLGRIGYGGPKNDEQALGFARAKCRPMLEALDYMWEAREKNN